MLLNHIRFREDMAYRRVFMLRKDMEGYCVISSRNWVIHLIKYDIAYAGKVFRTY